MRQIKAILLGFCAGVVASSCAFAADLPSRKAPEPLLVEDSFNPWMIRLRAVDVLPVSSGKVYSGGTLLNGGLNVSNAVVPELDISYFITKNIALEAICCVTPHTVKATGGLSNLGEVGKTILFPPTLMLQYHLTQFGALKPYAGIGVNYSHFFQNGDGPKFSNLQINDSWGIAGQIGFDYMIDRHWGINFDVKKIYIEPKATVTLLPSTPLTANVKIDPWIIGTGVTYRF
jgi:outer membrane protein